MEINMATINPQDIYLLETFSSTAYLAELRDTWDEMVQHLEDCLERFMLNLPLDYRRRPLPEQPDAVWGETVLPNFRASHEALCAGVVALSQGDASGLYSANQPNNDYMGQREFSDAWLSAGERAHYLTLLEKAARMAANVCATVETYWEPGQFHDFQRQFGPLAMPPALPAYRLNGAISVRTDAIVARSGVYQPDLEHSIAAFLVSGNNAPHATVVVGTEDLLDETGAKYGEQTDTEEQACLWTLVERDAGAGARPQAPSLVPADTHRIAGGDVCPVAGYYFTPAKAGSRQHFAQGQVMPTFDSAYGATVWQWDAS
jgi:hypothetical protein